MRLVSCSRRQSKFRASKIIPAAFYFLLEFHDRKSSGCAAWRVHSCCQFFVVVSTRVISWAFTYKVQSSYDETHRPQRTWRSVSHYNTNATERWLQLCVAFHLCCERFSTCDIFWFQSVPELAAYNVLFYSNHPSPLVTLRLPRLQNLHAEVKSEAVTIRRHVSVGRGLSLLNSG